MVHVLVRVLLSAWTYYPSRPHFLTVSAFLRSHLELPRCGHYPALMDPDDNVCLCFKVSLRKLASFAARENPTVASQLSECLGAGTGCQWCVPFLKKLHTLHVDGKPLDLPVSPEEYAARRAVYRKTKVHDEPE
jgi:bacterioferritin-associated ferredoxin